MEQKKQVRRDIKQAINYCRFQKDRNWRNFQKCKGNLEKALSELSTKSEEELTKKDLLYLISSNCDYMRSLNLYNYYKEELSHLLVMEQDGVGEVVENGTRV